MESSPGSIRETKTPTLSILLMDRDPTGRNIETAIRIASGMPYNSAATYYEYAGAVPDLRFGGNCIHMVETFMRYNPGSRMTILAATGVMGPHFALEVDEMFYDPTWSQAEITTGISSTYLDIYEIHASKLEGYWRVSYEYTPYYRRIRGEGGSSIYVEHMRGFEGTITDAKDLVCRQIRQYPHNYHISYCADGGETDLSIYYYPKDRSFRLGMRNIDFQGHAEDPTSIAYRDRELRELYGFSLSDLQDYFEGVPMS